MHLDEKLRELWLKLGDIQTEINNLVNQRNRIMYALARYSQFLEVKVYAENEENPEVREMCRVGADGGEVFFWYRGGGPGRAAGFYHGDSSRKKIPEGEQVMMHRVVRIGHKDQAWPRLVRAMLRSSAALKYDVIRQRRTA